MAIRAEVDRDGRNHANQSGERPRVRRESGWSLRIRAVWCGWRFDQAQAGTCALQFGEGKAAVRQLRGNRRFSRRLGPGRVSQPGYEFPAGRNWLSGHLGVVPEAAVLRARRFCGSRYVYETPRTAGFARRGATYGGQLSFLSGDRTQVFFADRATVGSSRAFAAGEWTLAPGGNRKAVWTRSGLCSGAEPRYQECAAGKSDLSHRSLSGQRDGAEHHGLPVRQCYFRAHLEPAVR